MCPAWFGLCHAYLYWLIFATNFCVCVCVIFLLTIVDDLSDAKDFDDGNFLSEM